MLRISGATAKIPCRQTLSTNLLREYYLDLKKQIKLSLSSDKNITICATTDCWTNANNESFLGLTIHYISDEFYLVSNTLALTHLSGAHSSQNLSSTLQQTLTDWNIFDKVKYFCSDNGRNIVLALELLNSVTVIPCSCHCLNLCVEDILNSKSSLNLSDTKIKELISKNNTDNS